MKLPAKLHARLSSWALGIANGRPPDHVIGSSDSPYLLRWYTLPRNRWANVYVHRFCRSDDDRALHDHPWINCSILIKGRYREHTIERGGINRWTLREAGEIKLRLPTAAHRVELVDGPCWTLFLTGPRVREWGFHCPWGWRHWREFTAGPKGQEIGKGCDP
jgi:hypothetical protein